MSFLDRFSPQLLSVLRIMAALLFMEHGMSKLFGFPPTEMFATPPPVGSLIWVAGVLETVGGALLTLGLFTQPVACVLSGEMAAAYFLGHAPRAAFPVQNEGDAAILFCFVFLYIAAAGPGPWALDGMVFRRK